MAVVVYIEVEKGIPYILFDDPPSVIFIIVE
jgi:hypothetical protein